MSRIIKTDETIMAAAIQEAEPLQGHSDPVPAVVLRNHADIREVHAPAGTPCFLLTVIPGLSAIR